MCFMFLDLWIHQISLHLGNRWSPLEFYYLFSDYQNYTKFKHYRSN